MVTVRPFESAHFSAPGGYISAALPSIVLEFPPPQETISKAVIRVEKNIRNLIALNYTRIFPKMLSYPNV